MVARRRQLVALLGIWVPQRPLTVAGRVAVRIWAAPMTAIGLVAGAASATKPRLRDGVVVFAPARGLTGAVIRKRGFSATGLGHVVICVTEPSPQLWAHELVHVRQAERLGPLMIPVYLALLAAYGYTRNPLEMAARLGSGDLRPLR